ncbi:cobalamin-binding protein [Undibacterium sp. SXout7W]|uniref:cobalamin-binding protein n=1 Tax=Undibacterium sp. SXout7W TaxID=3413049 RepID=UPI003BF3DF29
MKKIIKVIQNNWPVFFLLGVFSVATAAPVIVSDDAGNTLTINRAPQRIVSLAPHVTELIFAAGAGDKIVGTVRYSDFPAAAKDIPRIGDNRQLDMERVMALKPDLLVVWMHGAFERQLDVLKQSGIPFFFSEPHKLEQIPETLVKFGSMFGTEKTANAAAADFRQRLSELTNKYQGKPKVRTFYQVWHKPLYTLNDKHIVSDAIRLCGGENIFGKLPVTAPVVSIEAVLHENPEVLISAESKNQRDNGLEQWKTFSSMTAVKNNQLMTVDGDLVNRSGPRIIDGAAAICDALEQARIHRNSGNNKENKGKK